MSLPSFKLLLLRAHLALRRFGWSNIVVMLFGVLTIIAWYLLVPYARRELASQQRTLQRLRIEAQTAHKPDDVPPPSTNEVRLNAFYNALGERRYAEQQVKTLFAVASKTSLTLNQGEYRLAFDKNGRFHTYQITLPVKGSYRGIRQFCEQVLVAIPFASLDQMNFKRDTITNNIVEAQLHFTLYLADAAPQDVAKSLIRADAKEAVE